MKLRITTLLLAVASILFVACTQQAQQTTEKDTSSQEINHPKVENYIVLTNNIQQIRAISNAALIMKGESPKEFGEMEVVVCGKTVEEMTNTETMAPLLEAIEAGDLKVKVCGFSLKQLKVDSTQLPSQVSIVENGIYYNFKKQHEGYNSLGI